jgi:3-mercaptopyruvate sulfurtransferase SseA
VCCGDSSYASDAARLFWLLELSGAGGAAILEGGVRAWVRAGQPVERTEDPTASATWAVAPDPDRLATTDHVRSAYGEPGVEIVDARGRGAWEGAVEHPRGAPAPRTGHIPHALPFDFRQFLTPDDRFVEPQDTREILSTFGPRPGTHVDLWGEFIVHDDGLSGHGAVGYFFLRRAGVENVRYYPGGWERWASARDLPVVRIIHAEELERRLDAERRWFRPGAPPTGFAVFDVRHRMDYERGHIPGAVNLTSAFFADSLAVVLGRYWPDLDRSDAPIVTYCYGPTCIRSRNCSTVAARAGFVNVERLYGGLEEWLEGGRPVAR